MGPGCGGRESGVRSFGHGDQRRLCRGVPRLYPERAEVYEPGTVLFVGTGAEPGLGLQAQASGCAWWGWWRTWRRTDGSGCCGGPVGCDAQEPAPACVFGERVLRFGYAILFNRV